MVWPPASAPGFSALCLQPPGGGTSRARTICATPTPAPHAPQPRRRQRDPAAPAGPGPEWDKWSGVPTGRELRRVVGGKEQTGVVLHRVSAAASVRGERRPA